MIVNRESLYKKQPLEPMYSVKLKNNGVSHGLAEAGYDIRIKQDVWLFPGRRFALASAIEKFRMPYDLVGIVHDKSTWARRGLSVFNTVIEPGWVGFLTLELVYHGWRPMRIHAGSGIAQVLFHKLTDTATYSGKYQYQEDVPTPAILDYDL